LVVVQAVDRIVAVELLVDQVVAVQKLQAVVLVQLGKVMPVVLLVEAGVNLLLV
jgi:hypothetical protein